jgi:hypothetical protein
MAYDVLIYEQYRLRKIGVREISIDTKRLLRIETEEISIKVKISSYENTRNDLDRVLSRVINEPWQIGEILEYFDEIWEEIYEFLNEKEEEVIIDQ